MGESDCGAPDPAKVPPQDPVYQFQLAKDPKFPFVKIKVEETPEHIDDGEADTEVAEVDTVFTTTVVLTHVVVLHVP